MEVNYKNEFSDEVKEELKELSYKMMLNEKDKLVIENNYYFNKRNKINDSNLSTEDGKNMALLRADQDGFAMSLKFNDILLRNGSMVTPSRDIPDAANIWAENYLNKYGLKYPISWYISSIDRDKLNFGYYSSKTIEHTHENFLRKINALDVSAFEKKRLSGIAEYYRAHRLLVCHYFNPESVKEVEEPASKLVR